MTMLSKRTAMPTKVAAALVALLAGALMLSNRDVFARDGGDFGKATSSLSIARMKGWIELHRPDGEVVHIKADQIVFVMSAIDIGAAKRAQSKLQLMNGFIDVRECVEEVMQVIQKDEPPVPFGT
jgi:hypothetical protein